ncbi:MAG: histidine kinase [Acidobacteriia bacterium]|nr:histidine kinase [Terriglobia bacterium]
MEAPQTKDDGMTIRGFPFFWLLQCAGWLAYGVAMFAWGLDYFNTLDAFVNKALLAATGFALTLLLRVLYWRARARSMRPLASALLVFVTSFSGAAVWRECHTLLFELYRNAGRSEGLAITLVKIPLGTWLYDGLVLLAWSLLYYGLNDWIEIERQKERVLRAETMAHQARLRALQSQLEPHFLFNTLNAISTLVAEGHNSDAVRMIARVSDFLRLTLDANETPEISVTEELEFVRRYLEIEQVRFGDRLRVTIDAQPEAMPALVPALVLQPLVENAVKHGILPRERGGSVAVTIAMQDGTLRISVADDGPGLSQDSDLQRGVGLSNTAARLKELYGNQSRFSVVPSAAGGVTAVIELPFRTARPPLDAVAVPGARE